MKQKYLNMKILIIVISIFFNVNVYAQKKNTQKVENIKTNQVTPANCDLMSVAKEYEKIEKSHHILFKKLEELREKSLSMRAILLSFNKSNFEVTHFPEGNFNYEKAVELFQPFKERLQKVESLIAKCAKLNKNNSIYFILQLNLVRGLYYDQSIMLREIQAHDNELHILNLKRKIKELEKTKKQEHEGKKNHKSFI